MAEWQPVETAPTNIRILITQSGPPPSDQCAMAWLDILDQRLYYSPQGGLVGWTPTHWMPLPDPPSVIDPQSNFDDSVADDGSWVKQYSEEKQ